MTPQQQNALHNADQAERCHHFHLTGRQCGSPALAGRRLCYFHQRALHPKVPSYKLPLLEDAASVQFGLFQIARALEDKAYDSKTSALLLYALQTASSNLRRLHEEREQFRLADERQQSGSGTSSESFADIVIRGLGLRPPDPAKQNAARYEDAGPMQDSPAPPFDPLQEALEAEFRVGMEEAASMSDPPAPASPARRGPVSARRSSSNDQRRTTNDERARS